LTTVLNFQIRDFDSTHPPSLRYLDNGFVFLDSQQSAVSFRATNTPYLSIVKKARQTEKQLRLIKFNGLV
jgi:hypothetical protein